MPCFHPLTVWQSRHVKSNGKSTILFHAPNNPLKWDQISLPCRRCIGCRLENSRQMAVRCFHHSQMFEDNCFITLTYSDDYLPDPPTLIVKHWQLFMKRLRKRFGAGISFFHCGEYGEKLGRPHYHACIFNFDFHDKVLWKQTNTGDYLYTSKSLEELWTFPGEDQPIGFCTIGDLTFQSAAYVARYILKKVNGELGWEHYLYYDRETGEYILDPETGDYISLHQEYMTNSNGIGKSWYEKYKDDVFPHDYIVVNGKPQKPPRYYDLQLELDDPEIFVDIKQRRKDNADKNVDNNTPERLNVREKCKIADITKLQRPYETE